MSKVRSRHSDLLNYFIFKPQDLSVAYVKQCEEFFKDIGVEEYTDEGHRISSCIPARHRNLILFARKAINVIRNERPCNCKKEEGVQ